MIRFERTPFTKRVKIIFKKKPSFFSKELMTALLAAIVFHGVMMGVFSIENPSAKGDTVISRAKVALEVPAAPIALDLSDPVEQTINLPPSIPISSDFNKKIDPFDDLFLEETPIKIKNSLLFVRGPFPFQRTLPQIKSSKKNDFAVLSLRSDPSGKLLWYDFKKKPEDQKIIAPLESWIKQLDFSPESAFVPQLLEVFFSYD